MGVGSLRVVDRERGDPLGGVDYRELMVDIRYPARWEAGEAAAQFGAGEAAAFGELAGRFNYGVEPGGFDWAATRTHAYRDVPVREGRWPVVIYSPGLGDARAWNTGLVDDLVSRGHVVITIDHTYDSSGVQFPDGRVVRSVLFDAEPSRELIKTVLDTRVADLRFVLDQLPHVAARFRMDLRRVAVVGHSAGGAAGLQAMYEDARIKAAVNFDGQLSYAFTDDGSDLIQVAQAGLCRPFLLVGAGPPKPSWRALMAHSEGPHSALSAPHATHASFTDAEALLRGDPHGLVEWNRRVVADFLDRAIG
ncbi:putative dienelactone hydrolase [Actinokineospora sp. UTMC 2448]|nr:putative dienelactone hydrolase [Actinokineospora sp. UTMC 2448]